MTDRKQEHKQKLKDAELRQALADAEASEIALAQAKIALAEQASKKAIQDAGPDLTGSFTYNAEVTENSVELLRTRLTSFARRNPGAPINVHFTSPGGSVFDGLHLYATLRDLSADGHFITTVASGFAASMGAVLLQAGDHRVIGAESLVMLHEVSSVAIGKAGEIRRESDFLDKLTKQMCAIHARRSTMTEDEIYQKVQNFDWWIWPDEAFNIGFVDEVRPA